MKLIGCSALASGSAVWISKDLSNDRGTGAIQLERIRVPIINLPYNFEGYKIGFITDLHLGIWVPEWWIERAFSLVNSEKVDLLILGGDYIGVPENPWWERCGAVRNEMFAGLPRRVVIPRIFERMAEILSSYTFKDGMLAVAGNHEHWNSTREFLRTFRNQGFSLLMNESHTIHKGNETITFFGTDDFLTGIPRLPQPKHFFPENQSNINILISHNPDLISYGIGRDKDQFPFSLSISGHTHGGQVCLPGVGPVTYQITDSRFGAGLVTVNGKTSYTSRGLGVVAVPFRISCPPEVTVFELVRVTNS